MKVAFCASSISDCSFTSPALTRPRHFFLVDSQHFDFEVQSFAREWMIEIEDHRGLLHLAYMDEHFFSLRPSSVKRRADSRILEGKISCGNFFEASRIHFEIIFRAADALYFRWNRIVTGPSHHQKNKVPANIPVGWRARIFYLIYCRPISLRTDGFNVLSRVNDSCRTSTRSVPATMPRRNATIANCTIAIVKASPIRNPYATTGGPGRKNLQENTDILCVKHGLIKNDRAPGDLEVNAGSAQQVLAGSDKNILVGFHTCAIH